MHLPKSTLPLVCDPGAIPASQRAAHFQLAAELFQSTRLTSEELPNGYGFEFPASAFDAIVRFVGNERRCCPAVQFEIEVAAGNGKIGLRMTGPEGVREFLAAELPLAGVTACAGGCR